jgi:hypothetical protein
MITNGRRGRFGLRLSMFDAGVRAEQHGYAWMTKSSYACDERHHEAKSELNASAVVIPYFAYFYMYSPIQTISCPIHYAYPSKMPILFYTHTQTVHHHY